ncbi:MAG TPA: phenylalanine--tRNA ligase subunit alpha [Candidatus Dormibacteraeota bacterium]|jgi:phenylalanyl-tRNA synthetase alpha chain
MTHHTLGELQALTEPAERDIQAANDLADLEALRAKYLGRKGLLSERLRGIEQMPPEERRAYGAAANGFKEWLHKAIEMRRAAIQDAHLADIAETEAIDITFPGPPLGRGHTHVLTLVQRQIETVLESLGYQVELGPEVETEWYNFEALNIPAGHPARENWDSFYFTPDLLLRTHTSPVQIRAMQRIKEPPIYIITPGRCYRRDAPEATRVPYFSQVEGLAVDKGLTVGDMKGTLLYMIQSLYGEERKVRVRPSFFPFTEPSFEFDVSCGICAGAGCKSCRYKGWLEVGGCGMVHPQVLRNGGVDPEDWNGYAWGFGIERMAMLKHDVDDIRLFYESDLRFLEQF